MKRFNAKRLAEKKSHEEIVAETTEANRIENQSDSNEIKGESNFVSFAWTMILLWPVLGIIVEFICTGLYQWKTEMAEILGFWILWISAGIGIYFCGKLFSKAASSSQSLKNVSETFNTDVEKKFPKFPWGSIGGIAVLVMVLIRHWDGVSHFFTSTIHTVSQSQQPPPQQQQQAAKPITVKGFYIGMSADDVCEQIKNTPGIGYEPAWIGDGTIIETGFQPATGKSQMDFVMDGKRGGKLLGFSWYPDAVDMLFNSSSLNVNEFVQQFANSYNIPKFTSRQTPKGDWQWVYRSPDNITITILSDKGIIIEKDNSQQDIQRSFN